MNEILLRMQYFKVFSVYLDKYVYVEKNIKVVLSFFLLRNT